LNVAHLPDWKTDPRRLISPGMDCGPIGELKIEGTWQAITLDPALRLDKGA